MVAGWRVGMAMNHGKLRQLQCERRGRVSSDCAGKGVVGGSKMAGNSIGAAGPEEEEGYGLAEKWEEWQTKKMIHRGVALGFQFHSPIVSRGCTVVISILVFVVVVFFLLFASVLFFAPCLLLHLQSEGTQLIEKKKAME